jgi:hypothetical protein
MIRSLAVAWSAAAALLSSSAAQLQGGSPLDKDLALFLEWFPGRYDNELQVFWEPDLNVPEAERHERIHSVFRPVDLPAFGKHVFYVEQFQDGDPSKIYRQRVYSFSADAAADAIRLKIYTPEKPQAILGAWKSPQKLAGLKPADATTVQGCDVLWRRQANQFLGSIADGACRVVSSRSGKEIVIDDDLVLTESEIWIADRATTPEGVYVFGNKAGVPHKLKKVRPFECWTAILRGAKHGDSGEGLDDWQFQRGGLLHDQGGDLTLKTDEPAPREVRLKLRRVEWPSGPNRPSLTLYVHEGADKRAISYAWGEADAERLGINLRWLQASCTHAPERLWEGPSGLPFFDKEPSKPRSQR